MRIYKELRPIYKKMTIDVAILTIDFLLFFLDNEKRGGMVSTE